MPNVSFADLIALYRHTRFDGNGGGALYVASKEIAATLRTIDSDQDLYDQVQISLVEAAEFDVGQEVRINIASPSHKFGYLCQNFDALFRTPGAAFVEPENYYVIDPGYAPGDEPVPPALARYRALLTIITALRNSATYVSELQRELVFIGTDKIAIPVEFAEADLPSTLEHLSPRLHRVLDGQIHTDEKYGLLADAVIEMTRAQPSARRFVHLVANLDHLCEEVEKGYRMFVSSFSYSRIKKEIEAARLDYIGKIHKTISDIQGQLLGIPVATIVVASQLKSPGWCDSTFWTNTAVLLGAWVFVGLLWLAVRNQRHTLEAIGTDMKGQRERLERDHAAVHDDFVGMFNELDKRVSWHRCVLTIVGCVALVGAGLATTAYLMMTPRGSMACFLPG